MIVYDNIDNNITYNTDTTTTGWTVEYSTNLLPNQGYNSSQYTNERPQKDKIKWIRWKKPTSSGGEKVFYYKTVIK